MRILHFLTLLGLTTAAALPSGSHANTDVFKSIDPDGRVTYGDSPTDNAVDFELIEIRPTIERSDIDLDKRLERMAATTKRLRDDREHRQRVKQEKRHQDKETVVYYPAANPSHSHYRLNGRRNDRFNRQPHNRHQNSGFYRDSYSSSDTYRRYPGLNIGVRGSHFSGSLSLGNRSSQARQLPYSPLLQPR